MTTSIPAFRRDWLGKSLAGLVLGLLFALGCSALFHALTPNIGKSVQAQLAMWMVMPIWMLVLAASYGFASGIRAWQWLAVANVLVFVAWLLARFL